MLGYGDNINSTTLYGSDDMAGTGVSGSCRADSLLDAGTDGMEKDSARRHASGHADAAHLRSVCHFLACYAGAMLGCGATCIRIFKNITRMVETLHMEWDMIVLPNHVQITLTDGTGQLTVQESHSIMKLPVSYLLNARLSNLSWKVAEGKMDFQRAQKIFCHLISHHGMQLRNPWEVMLLVVAANASFCRLFGGDIAAMILVALATFVGYSYKIIFLKRKWDIKPVALVCAFISSVIGAGGYIFSLSATPEVALGTSVLYLIPGIPYINSVSDMIGAHYLCGFSRFMQGLVLTCCIALGMMAGILLMNLSVF